MPNIYNELNQLPKSEQSQEDKFQIVDWMQLPPLLVKNTQSISWLEKYKAQLASDADQQSLTEHLNQSVVTVSIKGQEKTVNQATEKLFDQYRENANVFFENPPSSFNDIIHPNIQIQSESLKNDTLKKISDILDSEEFNQKTSKSIFKSVMTQPTPILKMKDILRKNNGNLPEILRQLSIIANKEMSSRIKNIPPKVREFYQVVQLLEKNTTDSTTLSKLQEMYEKNTTKFKQTEMSATKERNNKNITIGLKR